jgi:hypothetical protein
MTSLGIGFPCWIISQSIGPNNLLHSFLAKVVDSLYLVLDWPKLCMASTCKRFFLVEVATLQCLNKYLFRERIYKNIIEREML